MQIQFQKIIVHNFLSFGDAELDLANRNYVLVQGHNNNAEDGASSNGSGKSSIFNAICWTLTGETINGLKSNIPNIHAEDGCFVTLFFVVDGNEFEITRYREYGKIKNDLKIKINGVDHSGKGLRESEELLRNYLPNLTSDLIGNVIILGQGLPHRFSNNTPAGRKELLEKLSQSDFMIEDLKARLGDRTLYLNEELRKKEDNSLAFSTELGLLEKRLVSLDEEREGLSDPQTYEALISEQQQLEATYNQTLQSQLLEITSLEEEIQKLGTAYQEQSAEYLKQKEELLEAQTSATAEAREDVAHWQAEASSLQKEIERLEAITDVCPTCGQKLPDVHKPDTTSQREALAKAESALAAARAAVELATHFYEDKQAALKRVMDGTLQKIMTDKQAEEQKLAEHKSQVQSFQVALDQVRQKLFEYQATLDQLESKREALRKEHEATQLRVEELNSKLLYNKEALEDLQVHVDTLTKIGSLIKRDFRGVLLSNVIDFLDAKLKAYSVYVFNTQNVRLYLEGNNVNIECCGKAYDNLSGGERQKMDIIIQLAIRDMMCQYLNFQSNLLVIDEVFDGLDIAGCEGVLNLFSQVLVDVESLFIISHHASTLNISADDTLIIEKDNRGISRIIK